MHLFSYVRSLRHIRKMVPLTGLPGLFVFIYMGVPHWPLWATVGSCWLPWAPGWPASSFQPMVSESCFFCFFCFFGYFPSFFGHLAGWLTCWLAGQLSASSRWSSLSLHAPAPAHGCGILFWGVLSLVLDCYKPLPPLDCYKQLPPSVY